MRHQLGCAQARVLCSGRRETEVKSIGRERGRVYSHGQLRICTYLLGTCALGIVVLVYIHTQRYSARGRQKLAKALDHAMEPFFSTRNLNPTPESDTNATRTG